MFSKKVISLVIVSLFVFVSSVFSSEVFDDFNGYHVSLYDTEAPQCINEDIIIDTITNSKNYSSHLTGNGKLMIKDLKLHVNPSILEVGPLGERTGVLYTGKSSVMTLGISMWYHMVGMMYDFDAPCTELSMMFSYLNSRTVNAGKVVIILQEVDEEDNILWEETWNCTGYKSYYDGWENLDFGISRFESLIAGRTFNRVWLVEAGLHLDRTGGGYFDDITINVTQEEEEEESRELSAPEEEEEEEEISDPEPSLVAAAVEDIASLCPCENDWKNHGKYVSCIAKAGNDLELNYNEDELDEAISIAAQSDCGKKKKKNCGKKKNKKKNKRNNK